MCCKQGHQGRALHHRLAHQDTKISHEDNKTVSCVIEKIKARFGQITLTQGKEHVFLGININFHCDGTASIKMKDYIKEAIAALG
jgi:hypothetical protein